MPNLFSDLKDSVKFFENLMKDTYGEAKVK